MRLTVGPLPPAVYWRRRVVVLGGLLLVIVLLVYSCNGPDETDANAKNASKTSAPLGSSTARQVGAGPSSTPSAADVADSDLESPAVAVTSAASTVSPDASFCSDDELLVTPVPAAHQLKLGATTTIVLKIKNRSKRTCKRDVGADLQELYIVEQGTAQKVWSSDDCGGLRGSKVESFAPDFERAYSVSWNGRESINCKDRAVPEAGEYQLFGRVGTKRSDPVTLTLS